MSLPDSAEVLIVGGGPTGLVLALALQKHGCPDVVVVDAVAQGENSSRAVAIHAATIEAFEEIGVADQLVAAGLKVHRTTIWFDGLKGPIETAYFTPLAKYTKYPYILAAAQHVTEKILAAVAQERGIKIYRPHKVVDLKPNTEDRTLTDVIFDNGHVLRARCVAGADGSRSTVRRLMNIGWADPTGQADANKDESALANMFVSDVTISTPPPSPPFLVDAINVIVPNDSKGVLFVKLPDDSYSHESTDPVYRVAGTIHPSLGQPPAAPDAEYIQKLLDAWGPNRVLPSGTPRVEIRQKLWSSRFRTHSAVADRCFTRVPPRQPNEPEGGPVFLLGDAAHIHPPMGGQGMNLGIRDGVRLAPLLTEYIHATSASASAGVSRDELEATLRAWGVERLEKAVTVIKLVKGLQTAMDLPNKWCWFLGFIPYHPVWMRNLFMSFFMSFEWFRVRSAYRVSGLGNR